jgi:protein TonB
MGVAEGMNVQKVTPSYPEEAKTKHIHGDVILYVVIDKQGNVISTRAVSGDPLLAEAAVNAVKQWKYKPFLLNDEPVAIETSVKIQFRL